MNKEMKLEVGAQVRFLDSIGGGRVSRIEKGLVYVEDEDGFEIPTPVNKCVVVEQKDTFVPAYKPPRGATPSPSVNSPKPSAPKPEPEPVSQEVAQPIRPAHSYLPAQGEVNLLLAYTMEQGTTAGQSAYKTYLINDSDYSLYYSYKIEARVGKRLRSHGLIEPDQILMVDSFSPQEANLRAQYQLDAIAFSENPGDHKATYSIKGSLRIAKLFDSKSFSDTEFLEEGAYLITLVADGKVQGKTEEVNIDALRERMAQGTADGANIPKHSSNSIKTRSMQAKQDLALEIVNLHIEQLIDDLTGSDSSAILNRQLEEFDKCMLSSLRQIGKKLIFIHGRGNGVLRRRIEERLRLRYRGVQWTDAEPSVYAGGAIEITIS